MDQNLSILNTSQPKIIDIYTFKIDKTFIIIITRHERRSQRIKFKSL